MIQKFLLRWLVNFLGLWLAAALFTKTIQYDGSIVVLIVAALIFSLVNAVIRPIVVLLSLPAIVLTLGLFMFIVNAFMLYLVSVFYDRFQLTTFWGTVGAVIIIWIVNYLLTNLLEPKRGPETRL